MIVLAGADAEASSSHMLGGVPVDQDDHSCPILYRLSE